jgi:nucleotidyltransferase/DNA polymerase involved in DNA repair
MAEQGIHTIGDIARLESEERRKHLGNFGDELTKRALGIDDSPISTSHEVKSVSNETTFARDVADVQALYETLHWLSESVGRRLRKHSLAGTTVKLKLRWANFTTITRQLTLSQPTNDDREIYTTAKTCLIRYGKRKTCSIIRSWRNSIFKRSKPISLWDAPDKKIPNCSLRG